MLTSIQRLTGVDKASLTGNGRLCLTYDLRHVDLQGIEGALADAGFELANDWQAKIKRRLIWYTEMIQRGSEDTVTSWSGHVQDIYVSYYRSRRHGHRDDRRQNWRKYLK